MNKAELIDAIAELTGASKADTDRLLAAFMKVVGERMQNEEEVKLVSFGTFSVSKRKARKGRNPQTGKEIVIPARKVPMFRPGKELREMCHT